MSDSHLGDAVRALRAARACAVAALVLGIAQLLAMCLWSVVIVDWREARAFLPLHVVGSLLGCLALVVAFALVHRGIGGPESAQGLGRGWEAGAAGRAASGRWVARGLWCAALGATGCLVTPALVLVVLAQDPNAFRAPHPAWLAVASPWLTLGGFATWTALRHRETLRGVLPPAVPATAPVAFDATPPDTLAAARRHARHVAEAHFAAGLFGLPTGCLGMLGVLFGLSHGQVEPVAIAGFLAIAAGAAGSLFARDRIHRGLGGDPVALLLGLRVGIGAAAVGSLPAVAGLAVAGAALGVLPPEIGRALPSFAGAFTCAAPSLLALAVNGMVWLVHRRALQESAPHAGA